MSSVELLGTVINATDPDELASFYERMLGWPRIMDEPDWVAIRHPGGGTAVAFQRSPDRTSPTWPTEPGRQQALLHLDFGTEDLESAVALALSLGAVEPGRSQTAGERVLIDPAGNPFCLIERPSE
jgi:hypothetical protein